MADAAVPELRDQHRLDLAALDVATGAERSERDIARRIATMPLPRLLEVAR